MKTQQTPGTWRVEWTGTDDRGRQGFAIDTGDRQFKHDLLRGESVAREVAALPDLLAACEMVLAHGGSARWMEGNRICDLHTTVRAALALARGDAVTG